MNDKIVHAIKLHAPVSKVWDALANSKKFGEWFHVNIEGPFEEGKTSQGHITFPGYEHLEWNATIHKMIPEQLFSFSWHPYAVDVNKDYSQETPTLVEFTLEKTPDGTLLRVTESGFDKIPKDRAEEAYRMNDNGWLDQLINIEHYVTS